MIEVGRIKRAGLLATQGIRGTDNRSVLERIKATGEIFMAWSDEPWVVAGAAVNVSFIAYDDGSQQDRVLNGQPVVSINVDLTTGLDLTRAMPLAENAGIAFMGDIKAGPFEILESVALEMIGHPNPDGRQNSDVVVPWVNGDDLAGRPRNRWIIDFGLVRSEADAALYEEPFEYVREIVKPVRLASPSACCRKLWWLHHNRRPRMTAALVGLDRYVATVRHSKFRLFVWLPAKALPDSALIAFARDDDYTFGVLHSRPHELWALAQGTQLETRPRYTPTTCFETFPFPRPTDAQRDAVAEAARTLDRLRIGWLNPPGLSAADLAKRTLTNLYNARPTWLAQAHERLDAAVLAAYGWPADIDREDLLARLLALNLARAGGEVTAG